jgi:AcrR family transcriptional regulator
MKLFGEGGFDATGVAQICTTAGVSKGSFYHHFQSKQAVFLQLLEDWLRGVESDLQNALRDGPTVVEGLLEMAERTRGVFGAADGRLSLFLEFWAQARKDPEVWQRTVAPFRLYRDTFAAIVRQGVEEGSLRPIDPDVAAQAIISLAVGVILQGVLDPGGAAWDRVAKDSVRLLVEGIGLRRQQWF